MNAAMHPVSDVLSCYERLGELSRRLLDHARREEWGAVPALEEECSALAELLRHIEPHEELDAAQLLRKHALLSSIRCDFDAAAQAVQPQLQQLQEALETMQKERMLRAFDHPQAAG